MGPLRDKQAEHPVPTPDAIGRSISAQEERRSERKGQPAHAFAPRRPARVETKGHSFFVREVDLINNRQGGRRRGRGGQRTQNLGGQPGNRQDNRQRGNAAQLLEKYKSMARDAQLAGDRVQTEYYLQFADHYYRVLGESRARFEEQRRQRGDYDDESDGDDETLDGAEAQGGDDQREEDRPERSERRERRPRYNREARGRDEDRETRGNGAASGESDDDGIPFDVLPPAIGAETEASADDDSEPVERPRRRTRRPRANSDEADIAPAA